MTNVLSLGITWGSHSTLTVALASAVTKPGVGFELLREGTGTGNPSIDQFTMSYFPALTGLKANTLVASANGELWYTDASSVLTQVTGGSLNSLELSSDRMLQAVDRLGNLYIADAGPYRASGLDGVISGTPATTFDSASYADWRTVADEGDVLWIYAKGTGGSDDDVREYKITAVAENTLTISPAATASTAVSFRVVRSTKVFDTSLLQLQALNALVTTGQAPGGCPLIAVYRDRLVLGGSPIAPHAWYMSRVSDPLDWNYGASDLDSGRAVAGTTADAEKLAEPLTALIAASTDYLLFGTRNSLWRLQGDPAGGGSIVNLSRVVGVISRGAWCWGPAGEIVFLSRAGIYYLPPGAAAVPQALSAEVLPDELRDVDPDTNTISMCYDAFDEGIHVYVVGTQTQHWWIDWQTQTFWPVTLDYTHDPFAIAPYKEIGGGVSDVLLGCCDGYIRRYLDVNDEDDGLPITSSATYGPILLGDDGFEGVLNSMDAALAGDSGDVTWEVLVGPTHEAAVQADVFANGTWVAGQNYTCRPRARGASFCLRLTSTEAWEIERIVANIVTAGRQRKL